MEAFLGEQQSEEDGHQHQDEAFRSACEQLTLGQEGDQAFMGHVPGVFVEPVVKLRRGGKGSGAHPQKQHQTDKEDFADPALTVRFVAKLHVQVIKLRVWTPRKPLFFKFFLHLKNKSRL